MDLTESDFEKILYYYQMLCLSERKAQSEKLKAF